MSLVEKMAWALFVRECGSCFSGVSEEYWDSNEAAREWWNEMARAALKALSDAGYAVVPLETTKHMRIDGLVAFSKYVEGLQGEIVTEEDDDFKRAFRAGQLSHSSRELDAAYNAMLAAAPEVI